MTRYKCPSCGGNQYSASPSKAREPCVHCGHIGTELMKEIDPGEDGGIVRLTKDEALAVIESRTPIGKFFTSDGECIIGIDNTTGDAWTEEFTGLDACIRWMKDRSMTKEEAERHGRTRRNIC